MLNKNLLEKHLRALEKLNTLASMVNGQDWSPIQALKTGETVFGIEYNLVNDYLFITEHQFDSISNGSVYFKTKEGAATALSLLSDDEKVHLFSDIYEDSKNLPITYDAVKTAALLLINKNGFVTTLEIKEHLRSAGYHAKQAEVSQLMKEVAKKENLDFNALMTNGNLHISYSR